MKIRLLLSVASLMGFGVLVSWAFIVPVQAQESSSWLRIRKSPNALNPDISLIGDFLGTSAGNEDSGFSFREAELGLQSHVDPYARADFFFSVHEGESPELEEGYITLLSLPLGLQARGGKFLATFGRLNWIHSPEKPQVDNPLVLRDFLGAEGLNSTGLEISRIFAPFGIFAEWNYALLNDLGTVHEEAVTTAKVKDVNNNDVNVAIQSAKKEIPRKLRNFASVSRLRFYGDFSDNSNLEMGFSGVIHQPQGHEFQRTAGIDLTFRWKPLQQGLYRSFIWRTEALFTDRHLEQKVDPITSAVEDPERRINRKGVYSYAEYQFARHWRAGLRGDYAESPEIRTRRAISRAISPYVTFTASEFNRFRLQYQNIQEAGHSKEEHKGFLQWTVVLGPHGAHPF